MRSGEIVHTSAEICGVALRIITDYISNQHHPKGHPEAKGFHLDANLRKCLLLPCFYLFIYFSPWKLGGRRQTPGPPAAPGREEAQSPRVGGVGPGLLRCGPGFTAAWAWETLWAPLHWGVSLSPQPVAAVWEKASQTPVYDHRTTGMTVRERTRPTGIARKRKLQRNTPPVCPPLLQELPDFVLHSRAARMS